jgi:hypothetical protein
MTFDFGEKKSITTEIDGKKIKIFRKEFIDAFNVDVLKIGKFNSDSEIVRCISAVFDLEGFTHFCSQTEPELYAGRFLKDFFDWLFQNIRDETIQKVIDNGYEIYHDLPFYSKFLGDGVLFIWDTGTMDEETQHNLIVSLSNICDNYVDNFYENVKDRYIEIPKKLRCGVAKGSVYSIGKKDDFIGPCINLASRLQSMPGITFSFARKGFNPEEKFQNFNESWLKKRVSIRGYNFDEIVVIEKSNFDEMVDKDKEYYQDF